MTAIRAGRPANTSRKAILDAASRLIEQEGWERLTIRRLAGELAVSPGTIYNYVRDKHALLTEILIEEGRGVQRPLLPPEPRERIVAVALLLHQTLVARPWIAEVGVSVGDALSIDSGLWFPEEIIGGAVEAGVDIESAARLWGHVWSYTVGDVSILAGRKHRQRHDGARDGGEDSSRIDAEEYPYLAQLPDRWQDLLTEDRYESGLRALLRGLLP
ncbi:MAG: helix-turn-helix domain-containing protein [Nocardioides sp.]